MSLAEWPAVFKLARMQFIERRCPAASAAVAFYAAFALAPTLVVVLAIAGVVLGQDAASGRLYGLFGEVMGDETARALQGMVGNAWNADGKLIKTAISVIAIVFGASAIFSQLKESLNEALAPENPGQNASQTSNPWFAMVHVRLLAVATTMGVTFLFMALLLVDTALAAATDWLWPLGAGPKSLLLAANHLFSTVFLAMLFALLLQVLPEVRLSRPAIFRAALLGAIFFNIGKHLFGLYLAKAATADAFGAAGSLAVMLMWLYFSALVFMFSAQIARAIDQVCTEGEHCHSTSKRQPT